MILQTAILWRYPHAVWLVAPTVLAVVNFLPFTGWVAVNECDALLLSAIAIFWFRESESSMHFDHSQRESRKWILWPIILLAVSHIAGISIALLEATPRQWASANPYIHPVNAWRVSKGLWFSLLLFPMVQRSYHRGVDVFDRLAWGVVIACCFVIVGGVWERWFFPGLWNLQSDYRIVGTWFDMHLGGSQIAIFIAMALPILVGLGLGGDWRLATALTIAFLFAGYCLVVSFARAGIVAGVIGLMIFSCISCGSLLFRRQKSTNRIMKLGWLALFALSFFCVLWFGISRSSFLESRLASVSSDFQARMQNWSTAWTSIKPTIRSMWLGHGTGAYAASQRSTFSPNHSPTDYSFDRESGEPFLIIRPGVSLYFGQKLLQRGKQPFQVHVQWRSDDPKARVNASVCEKILLYSSDCAGVSFPNLQPSGAWNDSQGAIDRSSFTNPDGRSPWVPLDFAFWVADTSSKVEIRRVSLVDQAGNELIGNTEFKTGMDRWYVSDDYHRCWRIENEIVSSWFEGGIIRVFAVIVLIGASAVMAFHRVLSGENSSVIAFSVLSVIGASFLFDTPLQSPRLSTLMYLFAFSQLFTYRKP